jgi:hypothetical protein
LFYTPWWRRAANVAPPARISFIHVGSTMTNLHPQAIYLVPEEPVEEITKDLAAK